MRKPTTCIDKNNLRTQISFAVTGKLISAFVFTTRILQFLLYLTPKFQASSSLLRLYRSICVRPVRKPHCWFSREAALIFKVCKFPSLMKVEKFTSVCKSYLFTAFISHSCQAVPYISDFLTFNKFYSTYVHADLSEILAKRQLCDTSEIIGQIKHAQMTRSCNIHSFHICFFNFDR